ncbi:MAG: Peptidoglycan-associated lipoprotein precursor [Syntrophaceae bacterium PtaU1.Bin231]|nr:MAG: Peptidoglycan-associated lipoprotein precursor [Syntrophaceae bacterium PtaU1.Bin231]
MRRNMVMFGIVALVLCFGLVFVTGCAKKSVVKEEAGVSQADEAKAKAAADEAARLKAQQEQEAREKAEREKALWEKAERERLAKEAAAAEEARKLAAKEAARQKMAAPELMDINFDFDKYNLRPQDRDILKRHAEWLLKNTEFAVAIEGHCDERGTAEYNMALGQRRAEAAKKFLQDSGVAEARMKTISYGKELPLDPGHNEAAWAKNRRAHFVVTPLSK